MPTAKKQAPEPSTDLVQRDPFTTEQYGSIETFADAIALVEAEFGQVTKAHEDPDLSDGFKQVGKDDKWRYVGVPLILLDWKFLTSDTIVKNGAPGEYVGIHAVAYREKGVAEKVFISDGGTGIYEQLKAYTARTGKRGGLGLNHGLRKSTYDYDGGKATTFYLDFSA